ncbi:MAG TPA: ATP-dependent DNA helicase [Saprospiraceae bacterium]|nr:ATP-dependent DNA helicase [Saprospiraceae bacterium]
MNKIKQEYLNTWQSAYKKLNQKQREAVDTIDGPVMVIAGPGTGKTQLLAVRIGNILLNTDVFPHNILCLTYTEAGATAMRERLTSFIGPDAYNVNFFTFHAFCNSVISENPQYFGDFKALQLVSDIELVEILRTVFDNLADEHPLKKLKGNEYNELNKLKQLFTIMKQEEWTSAYIHSKYEEYKEFVLDPERSNCIWRVNRDGFKKGDINPRLVNEALSKYTKLLGASEELESYKKIMTERERFDFQDMILWVIEKFQQHDELLAKYQERYQYILVDEYQDTNGSQNNLLFLLSDFWEKPNLFIVGDDDQSIFRFQGANMNSIMEFKDKYQPKEIVLTENYRSSQVILDSASKLIENNLDRLSHKYPDLDKNLTEHRSVKPEFSPEPQFLAYQNFVQEEAGIIEKIINLNNQGVAWKDIAIIYSKHRVVEDMVKYLTQKKIPLNVRKRVNVLYEPEVEKILKILEYLSIESKRPHYAEDILFEILHYHFWELDPYDIAMIALKCRHKDENNPEDDRYTKWRDALSSDIILKEANVRYPEKIKAVALIIESWFSQIHNVTIQTLIEIILTQSNMLNTILLSEDKSWKIQLVNTFFDFVKTEAAKSKQLKLDRLMEILAIMKDDNIELPAYHIISNENGINFLTAHAAKGLEFEHVFILRATRNMWEEKSGGSFNFPLPPTLTAASEGSEIEDERRLFYVAMTRAKNNLYITYPLMDQKEKQLVPSQFVAEIKGAELDISPIQVSEETTIEYVSELMKFTRGEATLIDDDLIERILQNFKISATSLNKYLKCKLTFYFETILKVPMARSATMGYGNAIHYSLEQFFININKSVPRSYGSSNLLLEYFNVGMEKYRSHFTTKEFENYTKHGHKLLLNYYEEYKNEWLLPRDFKVEHEIKLAEYKGVPISGKLDRINLFDDHISVTDYKTGRYDSAKLSKPKTGRPEGGDYWRQIMFYKLLIDNDKKYPWVMRSGIMDFVEQQKENGQDVFKRTTFDIHSEETELVGDQLVSAYSEIKAHIFTPGCGEEDCKWCNFVTRNMPVHAFTEMGEDDDDILGASLQLE